MDQAILTQASSFKFHIKPALLFSQPIACVFRRCLPNAYIGYCVLQWSMSVSKGKSDKATSCTKDVRSTDLPFNPSLIFNVSVVGIRAHHRPQLARPLMSLILSLLWIPLFRGAYIPTQLINSSIVLPHLQCFTVNVVSRF